VKENSEKLIKLQKNQDKNQNLTIKHFLWPSFRLEDLGLWAPSFGALTGIPRPPFY